MISFAYMTKAQLDALTLTATDPKKKIEIDRLYFCTDNNRIYKYNTTLSKFESYGERIEILTESQLPIAPVPDTLYVCYDNGKIIYYNNGGYQTIIDPGKILTATIPSNASVWTHDTTNNAYTITINMAGMKSTDVPTADIVADKNSTIFKAQAKAWSNIYCIDSQDNKFTVYAFAIPDTDIPIRFKY